MVPTPAYKGVIALVNVDEENSALLDAIDFDGYACRSFANGMELSHAWEKEGLSLAAVVSQGSILGMSGISLYEMLHHERVQKLPFYIIIGTDVQPHIMQKALESGITDVFRTPLRSEEAAIRIRFQLTYGKELTAKHKVIRQKEYRIPLAKRIFDIFFASLAILLLSPVFLIVILLLKLESRGPVFYYSPRVGTGYKVFKFYKFRSMYVNADRQLKNLKGLNQYTKAGAETPAAAGERDGITLCDECRSQGTQCRFPLYADNNSWCEKQYYGAGKQKGEAAFFKLKNDPRITKVGKVLRNTSIDELPQLLNVLKGDMSIVGNRPLPLYEAEKLTTDKYSLRFLAPAGITGLWQVEKRGKGEMSEEERLMLDNMYAKNHSFLNDIRLILKTIPALFQKESV
ncbi:MAG: sugar transferase [Chitinophagaceae bacterium]